MHHLRELWQYRELIRNLVVRDLKVRYKNSALGIAWSLLSPLLMMVVYTIFFQLMAGDSNLPNYPVFILCALLPWNFFSTSVLQATESIISAAPLMFLRLHGFINAQRLHRANSFIRVRKETAGKLLKEKYIAGLYAYGYIENRVGAFLSNPNVFEQYTITLLTIDSAISGAYKEVPPILHLVKRKNLK